MQQCHKTLETALQLERDFEHKLQAPALAAYHQGYQQQLQRASADVQKARKKYDLQVKNGETLRAAGKYFVMLPSQ